MIKCKRCGLTEEEWKKQEEEFYAKHTFYVEQVDCESCGQWHVRPIGDTIVTVNGKNACAKCGQSLPDKGCVHQCVNSVSLCHDCRDRSEIPTYELVAEL